MSPSSRGVFDGQSLFTTPTLAEAVPAVWFDLIQRSSSYVNVAVTSTTYADRTGTLNSRWGAVAAPNQVTTCCDLAGQSELWADMTAQDLLTTAHGYWTLLRARGVDHIVACTLPNALPFVLDADQQAQRLAYNDLLRDDDELDAVCDLAADPRFNDPTNSLYFDGPGVHPTALGARIMAGLLVPVLDPFM